MLYKVGDRVKVKPLKWFEDNCIRDIRLPGYHSKIKVEENTFAPAMEKWCEKFVTIKDTSLSHYILVEEGFCWYDWMFEDMAYKKYNNLRGLYGNRN